MAVSVHGDLNRGVPHLFLHVGQRLAVLDQSRRERVPEIVKAYPAEAGLFEQRVKNTPGEIGLEKRPPFARRKDPGQRTPPLGQSFSAPL